MTLSSVLTYSTLAVLATGAAIEPSHGIFNQTENHWLNNQSWPAAGASFVELRTSSTRTRKQAQGGWGKLEPEVDNLNIKAFPGDDQFAGTALGARYSDGSSTTDPLLLERKSPKSPKSGVQRTKFGPTPCTEQAPNGACSKVNEGRKKVVPVRAEIKGGNCHNYYEIAPLGTVGPAGEKLTGQNIVCRAKTFGAGCEKYVYGKRLALVYKACVKIPERCTSVKEPLTTMLGLLSSDPSHLHQGSTVPYRISAGQDDRKSYHDEIMFRFGGDYKAWKPSMYGVMSNPLSDRMAILAENLVADEFLNCDFGILTSQQLERTLLDGEESVAFNAWDSAFTSDPMYKAMLNDLYTVTVCSDHSYCTGELNQFTPGELDDTENGRRLENCLPRLMVIVTGGNLLTHSTNFNDALLGKLRDYSNLAYKYLARKFIAMSHESPYSALKCPMKLIQ